MNLAGVVCAVAFSGPDSDSQWLLSRRIAAAKAFTANGFAATFGGPCARNTRAADRYGLT